MPTSIQLQFAAALCLFAASVSAAGVDGLGDDEKVFYFLGVNIGKSLEALNLSDEEAAVVMEGLSENLAGNSVELDEAVYNQQLNALAQERMAAYAAEQEELSRAYLAKMAAEEDAVVLDSGVVYIETKAGTGRQPQPDSLIEAQYHGTLYDGTVFDSSRQRGQPLQIGLNQVVPCWTQAIALMKEGGTATIVCPPETAYGAQARGNIPPNAVLTFEVELIAVVDEPDAG